MINEEVRIKLAFLVSSTRHTDFVIFFTKCASIGTAHPLNLIRARGSKLYEQIMHLPEYYLVEAEKDALQRNKQKIRKALAHEPLRIVELGAGDGTKTRVFLGEFRHCTYYPVDISETALTDLEDRLSQEFANLKIAGLHMDYEQALAWLHKSKKMRTLVLFLGSNIGNFAPGEDIKFAKKIRHALHVGDYLILGFDLVKNHAVMEKAYDDERGVTKRFQLNALKRLNHQLGANFDRTAFAYWSRYDPQASAIISGLRSLREQSVYIAALEQTFQFRADEEIHMEYSRKYRIEEINRMAQMTGFQPVGHFFDSRKYFVDSLWRARGRRL